MGTKSVDTLEMSMKIPKNLKSGGLVQRKTPRKTKRMKRREITVFL